MSYARDPTITCRQLITPPPHHYCEPREMDAAAPLGETGLLKAGTSSISLADGLQCWCHRMAAHLLWQQDFG